MEAAAGVITSMLTTLPGWLFAKRTVEIWTFAADMSVKMALAQRSGLAERKYAVSDELCSGLLRLGPTFIKLGQILSTRYDILPYEYVKGLERLQDKVPPFDGKTAYAIVCDDVGASAFESFELKPFAAASLGQVHLARTHWGQQVAVKVQRPGLRELFDADLQNLRVLAELLRRLDRTPDSLLRDWREIFESNAAIIYEEIDYTNEGKNAKRFKKNFEGSTWIKVPEVYLNISSPRVLTMEFVPGVKINNVKKLEEMGVDRKDLARVSGECFMIQLLRHGYFHCDPHPGNLAVDTDGPNGSPRLIVYDYGMMDELTPTFRRALVNGFFALYESDAKAIVDALVEGGLLGGKVDRISTEAIARYFLNNFRERLALDRSSPMTREDRDKMRMQTMQQIGNELAAVAGDKPFRYPQSLPFVLRAFNALEGVGKGLDPDYDVTRIARRYIRSLIDLRDGSTALTAWKKTQKLLGWRPKDFASVIQSPRRVTKVYETLTRLEQGELQLRVRALELERAMIRNMIVQRASLLALLACAALNIGTVLAVTSQGATGLRLLLRRGVFASAAFFGVKAVILWRKFKLLQRGEQEGNYNAYLLEASNT